MIRKTGVSTGSKGKCDCFLFWKCNRIGQWKKNCNRKRYRRKGEGLNSELPQARETPSGWRGEITNLILERVCVPQSFNGFIGLE